MKATITTDGRKVLARIPYANGDGPAWARKVPGAKPEYNDEGKFLWWSYPLEMATCYAFRNVFGDELEVLYPLSNWARAQLEVDTALEQIRSGAATARLIRVEKEAPELAKAIASRPYQVEGAAFMTLSEKALLGDQPGLGKTLQTLAALIEHGAQNILVACPRTATRAVWERETNRWAPKIRTFVAQGGKKQREDAIRHFVTAGEWDGHPRMLIVNNVWSIAARKRVETRTVHHRDGTESEAKSYHPEPNIPWLFEQEWDAMVSDESHDTLASRNNVQSKHISNKRYGMVMLRKRLKVGGLAIALSGTPFRSKLERSWGTLNWLDPEKFSSFWNFARTHFETGFDGFGETVGTLQPDGRRLAVPLNPEAFNNELRPYYLARTKAEVARDLPPIVYAGTPSPSLPSGPNYVWIPMEGQQAAAYADMKKLAAAELANGRLTATGVLAEDTRLRQFANSYGKLDEEDVTFLPDLPSNKLDWILDFMKEHEEGKIVIASSFTKWIHLLSRKLTDEGYENMTLTGGTSDRGRKRLIERFQNPDDPARLAIINSKAGGTAITLDQADTMVLTDLPWTSDDEEQVIDRIHRVSRIHNVTVYRLVSEGTVDAWMASLTEAQRAILLAAKPRARKMAEELLK